MLSEGQIDTLVQRYRLQMARYENASKHVEQKLRRELRSHALQVLLSSRAKHPEDLREKLRRKADDPRYAYDELTKDLNRVVTDLAGCRVVVYDPRLEESVTHVVEGRFLLRSGPDSKEVHRKPSGYRATHLLVVLDDRDEIEISLRGAVCEVQVTSIASHVFNELEHDIRYKMQGVKPGTRVTRNLEDLEHASRLLDNVVERLQDERAREMVRSQSQIEDSEALRFALERIFDRPLVGEVDRLFRLLRSVVTPLTPQTLEVLDVAAAHDRGRSLHPDKADDVIWLTLGLMKEFGGEFREIAGQWRGPTTALKRAIIDAEEP